MSTGKLNKAEHKKRSKSYQAQLKDAIYKGDMEGILRSVMLLAVKNNDADDWKASPRTFMELTQVLLKYRQEFGGEEDMTDILRVISGGDE
jgi:hypothetical protein|tara:strand:- start:524 stop:796 length:273 start_codon:yes stop_codon:yes gene_type:complete